LFSLLQAKGENGESKTIEYELETMSSKDAMKFPIIGSCFLFGLYIVYKILPKEWVTLMLNLYLLLFGMASLIACFRPLYSKVFAWFSEHETTLPVWNVRIPYFLPSTDNVTSIFFTARSPISHITPKYFFCCRFPFISIY
jgi:hypothetical protein